MNRLLGRVGVERPAGDRVRPARERPLVDGCRGTGVHYRGVGSNDEDPAGVPGGDPKPLAIVRHSQYRPAATPTVFHAVVFVPAWTWTPEATVTPLQPLRSVSATMVAVLRAWVRGVMPSDGEGARRGEVRPE